MTNLGDMMLAALQPMGRNIEALTPADLAPIDEFHIQGPESTQEFAAHAKVRPERAVLGLRSGLGGSARYLAVEYGGRVTGLNLTHVFCDIAIMLLPRLGLSHRTVFLSKLWSGFEAFGCPPPVGTRIPEGIEQRTDASTAGHDHERKDCLYSGRFVRRFLTRKIWLAHVPELIRQRKL
jgi:hypothetical protein